MSQRSQQRTPDPGQYMVAIDLGSNSFHMVLARLEGGEVRAVQKLGEKVMLAAGLDDQNRLTPETIERGLTCLRRFAQAAENVDRHWMRCIGTNTLRRARNADVFLARAREILDAPVEVVAGREEARLIYLGVSHSLPEGGGRRLVFDIGGGSTEFIIGERFEAQLTESLHMGCVDYREKYFPKNSLSVRQFEKAVTQARRELLSIEASYRQSGWDSAVGSSGTVRSVEAVAQACGYCSSGVTREAMYKIRERLLKFKSADQIDLPELKEDRRSVFASGLAILIAISEQLGVERFITSEGAMREGILYDMLGRHAPEDVRERSVKALLARYGADIAQSVRVTTTAMDAMSQVEKDWKIATDEWRDMLNWAAQAHEIGLSISHSGYHKHGGYLLMHSDLAGFSKQEQKVLSLLVSGHRRKLRDIPFEELHESMRTPAIRLTLLLRFAVILHHGRRDDLLPSFAMKTSGRKLDVSFPKGWLEDHPLTAAELAEEQPVWSRLGIDLSVR
jgi:exopolyphosphatase/guanosine-5'-triphosphate,3'-diphosphate pyrophosphatase